MESMIKRRSLQAAFYLSMVLIIKPHFLIFTPMLLFSGFIFTFFLTFAFVVILNVLPFLYFGTQNYLILLQEWVMTMTLHNSDNSFLNSPNTFHHWLFQIINDSIPYIPSIISVSVIILLLILLLILRKRKAFQSDNNSFYVFSALVLISIIPNVTVTDTEHFLLALPLVVFLNIVLHKRRFGLFNFLIIISFIFYGFNWFDLWGREISTLLHNWGVLGIGNLAIIALSICFVYNNRKFPNYNYSFIILFHAN